MNDYGYSCISCGCEHVGHCVDADEYCQVVDDYRAYRDKHKWIIAKDELPSRDDYYLVWDGGVEMERVFVAEWFRCWQDVYYGQDELHTYSYITHWMELPNPPKGKQ